MSENDDSKQTDRDRDLEGDAYEIDLDLDGEEDLDTDAAIRDAVAAVDARTTTDADAEDDSEAEEDLVRRLQLEVEELRDRSVRTLADFENYRRRVDREREEHRRYAAAEALGLFVEVVDNLERALQAEGTLADLRVGVQMIHKQMHDILSRLGVTEVAAVGERFDPAHHEAVVREETDGVESPTVVEELQRGYWLHDRLLRPARVRVAVPESARPDAAAD